MAGVEAGGAAAPAWGECPRVLLPFPLTSPTSFYRREFWRDRYTIETLIKYSTAFSLAIIFPDPSTASDVMAVKEATTLCVARQVLSFFQGGRCFSPLALFSSSAERWKLLGYLLATTYPSFGRRSLQIFNQPGGK